jgi:hypothetical protein
MDVMRGAARVRRRRRATAQLDDPGPGQDTLTRGERAFAEALIDCILTELRPEIDARAQVHDVERSIREESR